MSYPLITTAQHVGELPHGACAVLRGFFAHHYPRAVTSPSSYTVESVAAIRVGESDYVAVTSLPEFLCGEAVNIIVEARWHENAVSLVAHLSAAAYNDVLPIHSYVAQLDKRISRVRDGFKRADDVSHDLRFIQGCPWLTPDQKRRLDKLSGQIATWYLAEEP